MSGTAENGMETIGMDFAVEVLVVWGLGRGREEGFARGTRLFLSASEDGLRLMVSGRAGKGGLI